MRPFLMSYVRGEDRGQAAPLPAVIEDYVTADAPMVNAFAADGANQSFGKTILPRRSCRNRLVTDAHGP
jgi:hypothetical protein